MSKQALKQEIRKYFKPTNAMKNDPMYLASTMRDWFKGVDSLQDFTWTALHGFTWAWSTGRLSGDVEFKIKSLTPAKVIDMLIDASLNCESQNDVPRYLMQRFAA